MSSFQELNERLNKVKLIEDRQMSDQEGVDNAREGEAIRAQSDFTPPDVGTPGIEIVIMFKENGYELLNKTRAVSGIHYEFKKRDGQIIKVFI